MWRYLLRGNNGMGSLADIVLAFTDFLEAEARALRAGVVKLFGALVLLLSSLIFILAGFLFIFWGFYLLLSWAICSRIWGAFLTGVIALFVSGILVAIAARKVKTRNRN